MSTLAIRGHETRGKEVIEILKMLGGNNKRGHSAFHHDLYYFLDKSNNTIDFGWVKYLYKAEDTLIFTLEEFLEKYPYKVEDKVIFTKYGDNDVVTIESMNWTGTTIEYNYNGGASCLAKDLRPYKEKNMESKPDLLQQLKDYFDNTPRDVIEKEWHEYDKYNEIGPNVIEYLEYINNIRQPKYSKTYKECCDVLGINTMDNDAKGYKHFLIIQFQELIIARDAYWKIAGEEMGLGKSWEPDWSSFSEGSYPTITKCNGKIIKTSIYTNDCFLAFPSEEMRDAFYENFKDLIEECRELL